MLLLHSFASIEEVIRGYAERPPEAAVRSTLCCIRHIIVAPTSAKPSRAYKRRARALYRVVPSATAVIAQATNLLCTMPGNKALS